MLKITQVLMPWQNNKPNPTCTVTEAAKPGILLEKLGKVSSVLLSWTVFYHKSQ